MDNQELFNNIRVHYAGLFDHTIFSYKNNDKGIKCRWSKESLSNHYFNNVNNSTKTRLVETINKIGNNHINNIKIKKNILPVICYLIDKSNSKTKCNSLWLCGEMLLNLDEAIIIKFFNTLSNELPLKNVAIFGNTEDNELYIISIMDKCFRYKIDTDTIEDMSNEIAREIVENTSEEEDDRDAMITESINAVRTLGFIFKT